ncbi:MULTISPECIES: hypothetical protein [Leptospirillum]|jgi:hypothetical protein|uniref:SAP domain-containing protein n=3 Tax=Leptospirillum ferriphilum TaxID=178606 RepID=A0A059XYM9_9BACT|nr:MULTISPECIES: hypothetical protein [Leptospirillum]EIJ75560.1 MAG: hypothetical protein C75L2_00710008 [Leptospirillum sp. Group II 'C75']AFS53246.1 hypothetical protein LFML04_1015 [Leptospirillum ferriphilum ML-04]AIA30302.1 SAP domain-containing protein [Leptospirillum ferriphilum YSK]AKS23785.1 SAP domain-containing protein [Leptospirillum sp. Group II 'CF-1']OOH75158.1 SAP domain-containing protein [Leptospirillum ferriphilum]
MNMQEIRAIARQRHMPPGRLKKADLIRALQRLEGNFDCFGSAREGICSQFECLWRKDCLGKNGDAANRK